MQFLSIFRNRKTPADYAALEHDRDVYRDNYNDVHGLYLKKADETLKQREIIARLTREKVEASNQAMQLLAELSKVRSEMEALRPDAEAHRARLTRDRDYHRNRRSLKTRALSLQPASPVMSESIGH